MKIVRLIGILSILLQAEIISPVEYRREFSELLKKISDNYYNT